MRKFKFNKPLVESELPPPVDTLWVDVDENTGKLASIKEFKNGEWKNMLGGGDSIFYDLGTLTWSDEVEPGVYYKENSTLELRIYGQVKLDKTKLPPSILKQSFFTAFNKFKLEVNLGKFVDTELVTDDWVYFPHSREGIYELHTDGWDAEIILNHVPHVEVQDLENIFRVYPLILRELFDNIGGDTDTLNVAFTVLPYFIVSNDENYVYLTLVQFID